MSIESQAELFNALSLDDRTIHRRAIELTIWGMPAVSMAAVRRLAEARPGRRLRRHRLLLEGPGSRATSSSPPTTRRPTSSPSSTSADGPMVLDVPPASAKTSCSAARSTPGRCRSPTSAPTGEDAGRGGRYLFLPPDHGGTPPDGYIVVPSPTGLRPRRPAPDHHRPGTLADAVAYSQRLKAYPLAQAAEPAGEPLRRRLPAGLEDAAHLRRELPPAPGGGDRGGAAAGEGRRHARAAGQHRHREGHAVRARRRRAQRS